MQHSSDTRLLYEIGFFGSDGMCCWWSVLWVEGWVSASPSLGLPTCAHRVWGFEQTTSASPLTFRQPSVISRMFSTHGITLQPDAFAMLPAEILSRTHTPSKIKKTTATIWPYSKHRKHFSTSPSWRTKDKNKQGIIPNLALQRFFTRRALLSAVIILAVIWTSFIQSEWWCTCYMCSSSIFIGIVMCL